MTTPNASTFSTRPEQVVEAERHEAVRGAVVLIAEGRPGRALFNLLRSLERQARLSGIRLDTNGDAA